MNKMLALLFLTVATFLAARVLISGTSATSGQIPVVAPLNTVSSSQALGFSSELVARRIGRKGKFEEIPIQGGIGVLVDGHWAFWVKEERIFALNGLAKSIVPDLDYGPRGLGILQLRDALKPIPAANGQVAKGVHENPLGIDVHDALRTKDYVAQGGDVNRSINVWKHRAAFVTITGQFEGRGNGMFYRRIISLELKRNGEVVWKAERIRVELGTLEIDLGSGWQPADIDG